MAKRSCDFCVRRKIRCDAGRPCRRCIDAKPPLECTYLNPVLKRGPKTSKLTSQRHADPKAIPPRDITQCQLGLPGTPSVESDRSDSKWIHRLPASIFAPVIEAYRTRMYPVWPVVNAPSLLARLEEPDGDDEPDLDAYILASALCSATMAQLGLTAIAQDNTLVDSTYLENECARIRSLTAYREHPSPENVLASFFLHVYHAKVDHRNAAMMHLQEAISLARLLHLDDLESEAFQPGYHNAEEQGYSKKLVYLLLWVSERGYAIQNGLRLSIQETVQIPATGPDEFDTYGEGLIELASLFAAFDSTLQKSSLFGFKSPDDTSDKQLLVTVQDTLISNTPRPTNFDTVQRTDYVITKQWMQVLLWQRAMAKGLLSSSSDVESMTFLFPSQIARELLASINTLSKEDLLPLGRDQLIKFFEITNTLADVILCNPAASIAASHNHAASSSRARSQSGDCCRYGPADFLHGLFQTISPFLEDDQRLNDMLRQKAAEALLRAPSRVLPGSIGGLLSGSSAAVFRDGIRPNHWLAPVGVSTADAMDESELEPLDPLLLGMGS